MNTLYLKTISSVSIPRDRETDREEKREREIQTDRETDRN